MPVWYLYFNVCGHVSASTIDVNVKKIVIEDHRLTFQEHTENVTISVSNVWSLNRLGDKFVSKQYGANSRICVMGFVSRNCIWQHSVACWRFFTKFRTIIKPQSTIFLHILGPVTSSVPKTDKNTEKDGDLPRLIKSVYTTKRLVDLKTKVLRETVEIEKYW